MSSELNKYITFLTETLGIKTILGFKSAGIAEISSKKDDVNSGCKYLFFVESLLDYNKNEIELLDKMIAALKIPTADFLISDLSKMDLNISDKKQSSVQIIFKSEPKLNNETYSPRYLIKQPELKRKAWEDLKRLTGLN